MIRASGVSFSVSGESDMFGGFYCWVVGKFKMFLYDFTVYRVGRSGLSFWCRSMRWILLQCECLFYIVRNDLIYIIL